MICLALYEDTCFEPETRVNLGLASEWDEVEMPARSLFPGFEPPTDAARWKRAKEQARLGEQVLLRKVHQTIRSPAEILSGDTDFKWLYQHVDVFVNLTSGFDAPLRAYSGSRHPVTLIGFKTFRGKNFEGNAINSSFYKPLRVLRNFRRNTDRLPRKIVAIGALDENWGWLSTHFTNRTASWGLSLTSKHGPFKADQLKEISPFLDDPNLLVLLVNQHHNVTHPKVISLPRGFYPHVAKVLWEAAKPPRFPMRKNKLLQVASSKWGPRPSILDCVSRSMGLYLKVEKRRKSAPLYAKSLLTSMAVLCLPGLGYDTFRLWESLAAGAMPVAERGVGLDRSLFRLPVLLVDDFADLSPALVKQAYVEALYRVDDWQYERMTSQWWLGLLQDVSKTGSISNLARLHPISEDEQSFTRPLVPFDCDKLGGCGAGTKRVPRRSCAINPATNFSSYNWNWEQNALYPDGFPLPGHDWYRFVQDGSLVRNLSWAPPVDDDGGQVQSSELSAEAVLTGTAGEGADSARPRTVRVRQAYRKRRRSKAGPERGGTANY